MGVYRVDESPNNRAGCQTKACKDEKVKITKGELRYAVQVTINEHQSWQYRHWGCVTPKQIENLVETCGGDTDLVDGYDELSAEYQEKIKYALENGHVHDDDWKGDVELNRKGQSGTKKRTPKKKTAKDPEEGDDSPSEKPKKKHARKAAPKDNDKQDEAPAPKKKRGRSAKKEAEEEEEADNESALEDAPAPPPKKQRAQPAKKAKVEDDAEEDTAPPLKSVRGRGKKIEYKEETEDDEEAPPPKKARSKKAAAKDDTKAPQKRGRKKKAAADEELS